MLRFVGIVMFPLIVAPGGTSVISGTDALALFTVTVDVPSEWNPARAGTTTVYVPFATPSKLKLPHILLVVVV
jgi:hypothetical protein